MCVVESGKGRSECAWSKVSEVERSSPGASPRWGAAQAVSKAASTTAAGVRNLKAHATKMSAPTARNHPARKAERVKGRALRPACDGRRGHQTERQGGAAGNRGEERG